MVEAKDNANPVDPGGKDSEVSRRRFLQGTAAIGGMAGLAAVGIAGPAAVDRFLRRHFHELSPERLEELLAGMSETYSKKYGKRVSVTNKPAIEGVNFGYGLDLSRCIGCRRCVYACVKENNQSREPQIQWIQVLEMDKEHGIHLSESNPYYDPKKVPEEDKFYMPVACQQCDNPPCTRACPVQATWQENDGIVVVDYDWCIGCRCCMAACPYGARRFNWAEPELPAEEVNPDMHVLGNRPRPKGVVEKCTFCIQRVRDGRYPACVEICPVGARKFGDLNDPESEIRKIMRQKRVFVLKEELNTKPKFYYFYAT